MAISVSGSLTATTSWATVSGSDIDTMNAGEVYVSYYFQAVNNDVLVKVQGSVNGVNYVDLNTFDDVNQDAQGSIIRVTNLGSALAIINPNNNAGINSAYRYYRVQGTGSSPGGLLSMWGFAK